MTAMPISSGTLVEDTSTATSWGAIAAGGIAAVAVSLFMMALGMGLGFTVVSPWSNEGISASTFSLAAGVYLVVMAMVASTVGGYIAGRLRSRWKVHGDEVYFRDTAHGFMAWAFGLVLTAGVMGAATTHLLSGAAAGSIAGTGLAQASPADPYIDVLLRPNSSEGAGAVVSGDTRRAEFARLMTPALRKDGDVSANDRAYMARVVSARTGLPQPEAEQRVNQVVTDAKAATDKARREAAKLSMWLAVSMLAGALAASLAAIEGGVLRDSRWYEPGWRKGEARI